MDEHDSASGVDFMTLKETFNYFMRFPSPLYMIFAFLVGSQIFIALRAYNVFGPLEEDAGARIAFGLTCAALSTVLGFIPDMIVCFLYQKLFGGELWHR